MSPPPPDAPAPPLILASASPRRRELLALLEVPFQVAPSAYDEPERETHPRPAAWAAHLAREKAREVSRRFPGALVLGADTVVALGPRLYAKPADAADARRMLRELSGRTHRVVTGIALLDGAAGTEQCAAVRTEVTFRSLEAAEIDAYVRTGEPMDKAGAYGIQGHGALLIERIRGDYPNVVGLPLVRLAGLLRERGLRILGRP